MYGDSPILSFALSPPRFLFLLAHNHKNTRKTYKKSCYRNTVLHSIMLPHIQMSSSSSSPIGSLLCGHDTISLNDKINILTEKCKIQKENTKTCVGQRCVYTHTYTYGWNAHNRQISHAFSTIFCVLNRPYNIAVIAIIEFIFHLFLDLFSLPWPYRNDQKWTAPNKIQRIELETKNKNKNKMLHF